MSIEMFVARLTDQPNSVSFGSTMSLIENHFDYTPSHFTNGEGESQVINEAGTNEGSCKIFALGRLLGLDEQQVLHCFGDYYRIDVLQHPDSDDHANIRNFMIHGWNGVVFDGVVLKEKK